MAERRVSFLKAMGEGLRDAMREDPTVTILGEDVDRSVIGATRGLIEEFGPTRVRNTPISEATFVGACVGAAAVGLRPVVDLMVGSFFYVAMDQVANQAAKLRYMSGGQVDLPIVYFTMSGPSGSAAAQHSENPHPMLMNVAGLKVVMPSTPRDAKGLMLAAVRDPNPVVFFQDAVLGGAKGPVPEEPYAIPLGVADVPREGSDVTLVAIGALVPKALKVARALEAEGVSVEVVDPRTLVPLDRDRILSSVAKTGRVVVADTPGARAAPRRRSCRRSARTPSTRSRPRRVGWPGRTYRCRSRRCSSSGCSSGRTTCVRRCSRRSATAWGSDVDVLLPKWGMSMQEGTITEWLAAPGEAVAEGQVIATVEADKVEAEIEAPATGTLVDIQVGEGETVDVGTVLARIEEP